MKPPNLNRRLVLEASVSASDGAGGQIASWIVLGTLWGELKPRSGRETTGAAGPLSTASYRITVRDAPPGQSKRPVPGQRMLLGARRFRILAVTEADVRGRYLTCLAEEELAV
ncbi:phage head closure protein [Puniceibacterium sediminis]|uniref:Phage head-tail adaptor, putative, SPP1 family n=1 Tax=Puniceibacterium sediminis TaxID=1608407 RepID=A0A238XQP6_9RHOB|nr:phage head closure protein [Puniceibacterium sediminis]SNR60898.1 phage head-tail adaptor, putative, SPP1 family [Puniceibacterium sediminis]